MLSASRVPKSSKRRSNSFCLAFCASLRSVRSCLRASGTPLGAGGCSEPAGSGVARRSLDLELVHALGLVEPLQVPLAEREDGDALAAGSIRRARASSPTCSTLPPRATVQIRAARTTSSPW